MQMLPRKSFKTCVTGCGRRRLPRKLHCSSCINKQVRLRAHHSTPSLRKAKQFHNRPKHRPDHEWLKQWEAVRAEIFPPGVQVLCARCVRDSRATVATVCDHIKPKALFPELSLAKHNLQPLCAPCHNYKSAQQLRGKAYDYKRGRVYDISVPGIEKVNEVKVA